MSINLRGKLWKSSAIEETDSVEGIVIANLSTCAYQSIYFRVTLLVSDLTLPFILFSPNFGFNSLFPVFSFLSPLLLISKIWKLSDSAVTYGDTIYKSDRSIKHLNRKEAKHPPDLKRMCLRMKSVNIEKNKRFD